MPVSGVQECECQWHVQAAAEVFAEHGEFIRAVLRSLHGRQDDVEDLYQDIFLFLARKPLPSQGMTRGYIYKMVVSRLVDERRKENRYRRLIDHAQQTKARSASEKDPHGVLIDLEETCRMLQMIEQRLPSVVAQAVTLRHVREMSVEETADTMGVLPRTVSRYASVGLRKLRGWFVREAEGR